MDYLVHNTLELDKGIIRGDQVFCKTTGGPIKKNRRKTRGLVFYNISVITYTCTPFLLVRSVLKRYSKREWVPALFSSMVALGSLSPLAQHAKDAVQA